MTILVPTDFSELSKVAAKYAGGLAERLKANIILLAVINPNSQSASSPNLEGSDSEMVKFADYAAELIRHIKKNIASDVEISYRSMVGFPVEYIIETFAMQNAIDLIVMGTKGASGLKKIVLGSNAVAVIDNSSRPVIVVPGETSFTQIRSIVYATDMVNHEEEIKTIARVAGFFNADIKVLHVLPGDSAKVMDTKQIAVDFIKHANYAKISFHISRNDQIAEEIDTFVVAQKADMLAMFTHKLDFYEKLFGRSVTRQLAFHSHLPLLTFNKTTLY